MAEVVYGKAILVLIKAFEQFFEGDRPYFYFVIAYFLGMTVAKDYIKAVKIFYLRGKVRRAGKQALPQP